MGRGHVLAGLADQRAQLLYVGIGEMVKPDGQGRLFRDQAVAPLLGHVQGHFFAGGAIALLVERGLDGLNLGVVELAHALADELHLAALAFEVGDALGLGQCVHELVGQLQALEEVAAQRQQILAQILQRIHFALEVGLGGFGRAFEFGLELNVKLAAFGDELASHEVAFFWFA